MGNVGIVASSIKRPQPTPFSPLFACGAECQIVNAAELNLGADWGHWIASSSILLESTIVDPDGGSKSYKLPASVSASLEKDYGFGGLGGATDFPAVVVGRVRFYASALDAFGFDINNIAIGGVGSFYVAVDNVSGMYVQDPGGGPTYSAAGVPSLNAWHTIDWSVDASANPWVTKARIDGGNEVSRNYAHAAGTWQGTTFENPNTASVVYLDNILLTRAAGDYPIGRGFILGYVPNTVSGTHSFGTEFKDQAAATISNGDNTGADLQDLPGDTTTWIGQEGTGASDYGEWVFNTSAATLVPRAVMLGLGVLASNTTVGHFEFQLNDGVVSARPGGTPYRNINVNVTTLKYIGFPYGTPPSGGSWTLALLKALRVRWGYSNNATGANYPKISNAFLEVEYRA